MFNSIFTSTDSLDFKSVAISFGVAIVLGLVVALAHQKTTRTAKNFLITLAGLPLLVAAVMMMINGSLGTSIAILGAFSLIRFRSIANDPKELLSVFLAMAIGLALGMGQVLFAVLFTALSIGVIFLTSKTNFLAPNANDRILKIVVPEDLDYESVFNDVFAEFTTKHELIKMKTINLGSLYKVTYLVKMKPGISEKAFLDDLRTKNCNLKVLLSHNLTEEEF